MALDFAPHKEVELLIRAAQFNIGFQHYGVVRLSQRVEQLVHRDRLFFLETFVKLVALEHLGHGVLGGEAYPVFRIHLAQPLAVKAYLGLVQVEEFVHLSHVGLGVSPNLFGTERGAWHGATGWIADHASKVADDEDYGVAHVLEMFQLAQQDGVAEVQVGSGGVETCLYAQWFAGDERFLQLSAEFRFATELGAAS